MGKYKVYSKTCNCEDYETIDCNDCDGEGYTFARNCSECPFFYGPSEECDEYKGEDKCKFPCDTCNSTGDSGVCSNCKGDGVYEVDEFDEAADWFYDNRYG